MSVFVWNFNRSAAPHTAEVSPTTLVVVRPAIQTLPDGSIVELKDDAQISVDFSGPLRAVSLARGTAYFQVAKDANRPFVVSAGGLAVRAVGTAFAVELESNELKVLVAEGKVRVDAAHEAAAPRAALPEPLVALGAVSTAAFPIVPGTVAAATTPRTMESAELQQRLGWRTPKLEFTRTPLRDVVAQMNQHNARKFVLADESVGDVRVSGVLRADKMDTLADTLQMDFGLETERRDDAIVVRRAK
jgi:transmembrane sensor